MAKRRSFEEILATEFRWPRAGDRAFAVSANSLENANVAIDEAMRLIAMTEGYKMAADIMVDETVEDETTRGLLVFPIIFNYRQFLELSLKYQLACFGPSVGVDPNWKVHDLAKLWAEFLVVLERFGTSDPDHADDIVQETVLEFAKIDPGSYSFRYPVDTKGQPLPIAYTELHLPTLKDVMNAVAGYFSGCDGYLDSLLNDSRH